MNAIVEQKTLAVPAHLAHLVSGKSTALAAMGGIISGPSIHQISIKAARFRLQDPQGQEQVIQQHYLDVIVVDANPNASKIYYAGIYNPAETEFKAPDCYSDNGIAPAARALKKQSVSCAQCPHNVWGSKITPNGSQTKACADAKKLAVLLADNPTGPSYLLKVPPASLKNLYTFVESLANRGIDLPLLVVRLEFDTAADYPKLKFNPMQWIDENQATAVQRLTGSNEIKQLLGIDEIRAGADVIATPAPAIMNHTNVPAEAFFSNPPLVSAAVPDAVPAEAPKRARRTKAEMGAATAPLNAPAESGFFAGLRQGTAPAASLPKPAAQVVVSPLVTSQALDDLIAQAMKA